MKIESRDNQNKTIHSSTTNNFQSPCIKFTIVLLKAFFKVHSTVVSAKLFIVKMICANNFVIYNCPIDDSAIELKTLDSSNIIILKPPCINLTTLN